MVRFIPITGAEAERGAIEKMSGEAIEQGQQVRENNLRFVGPNHAVLRREVRESSDVPGREKLTPPIGGTMGAKRLDDVAVKLKARCQSSRIGIVHRDPQDSADPTIATTVTDLSALAARHVASQMASTSCACAVSREKS